MRDVLLDTCIVIDFLRGNDRAGACIRSLDARPTISVITIAELFQGLRSQRSEIAVRAFLKDCRIVAISESIAELAGSILRTYRASHDLDMPDALIAATAEHHALQLMTVNVKQFPMFARLKAAY